MYSKRNIFVISALVLILSIITILPASADMEDDIKLTKDQKAPFNIMWAVVTGILGLFVAYMLFMNFLQHLKSIPLGGGVNALASWFMGFVTENIALVGTMIFFILVFVAMMLILFGLNLL